MPPSAQHPPVSEGPEPSKALTELLLGVAAQGQQNPPAVGSVLS